MSNDTQQTDQQRQPGLQLGDVFKHERSGRQFVVKAITRRDTGPGQAPRLVVEVEPHQDKA